MSVLPPSRGQGVKTCTACKIVHQRSEWNALKFIGNQSDEELLGENVVLELRICVCGSTLSIHRNTHYRRDVFRSRAAPAALQRFKAQRRHVSWG